MSPYIKQADRENLDISNIKPSDAGELNYVISSLVSQYLERKEVRYTNLNEIIGVLTAVQKEFYRRVVAPYEDKKIEENGDIEYPKV